MAEAKAKAEKPKVPKRTRAADNVVFVGRKQNQRFHDRHTLSQVTPFLFLLFFR